MALLESPHEAASGLLIRNQLSGVQPEETAGA
jgi:hypothetical protein